MNPVITFDLNKRDDSNLNQDKFTFNLSLSVFSLCINALYIKYRKTFVFSCRKKNEY